MLTPAQLGAPSKFDRWRTGQYRQLALLLDSDKRFSVRCIPAGAGKSLIYTMAALMTGRHTVVLTSNRALQDQLMLDFEEAGMTDVRGQRNYPCHAVAPGNILSREYGSMHPVSCDHGPCHAGVECRLRDSGCAYHDAVRLARANRLTVTSYAWWFAASKHSGASGGIVAPVADLLILDEAHFAAEELSRAISIEIDSEMLGRYAHWTCDEWEMVEWKKWAERAKWDVENDLEKMYNNIRGDQRKWMVDVRRHQSLLREVKRLASVHDSWIPEIDQTGSLAVSPIFPRFEAEKWLFRGAKKVVLMSSTITKRHARRLGIDTDDMDYSEAKSTFPRKNRPVRARGDVGVSFKSGQRDLREWARTIDETLDENPGNGIVHTASYERTRTYINLSLNRRIYTHPRGELGKTVERFKSHGGVLVSPSVTTGFDFPGDQCRVNIIAKVPFPGQETRLAKAREKVDRVYGLEVAAIHVQQASARGVRSEEDWCKTYIVDANIKWLVSRYSKLFSGWWLDSYKEE